MRPNRVATLNAGKFKVIFQYKKNIGVVLLMSLLLFTLSCDKGDDLETIGNKPPPDIVSPPVNITPPPNETPTDDESNIVYTDIEPDFTSENLNDSYDLDLNNDQIVDFTMRSFKDGYEWYLDIFIRVKGNGIWSGTPWYAHPIPLDSGDAIFVPRGYSYEAWSFFVLCYTWEQNCDFYWNENVDKYLGLRFIINGQTHYGWARVNVSSVTQWTIMDYAYNATPNKPILAGQRE